MSSRRISSYRARPDATVQRERSVLGAIYALVLTAKEKGRIADTNDPEDVKGRSESDFHAEARLP
jgi:hypothetical protein